MLNNKIEIGRIQADIRNIYEVTPMSQTKNDSKRETFFANY